MSEEKTPGEDLSAVAVAEEPTTEEQAEPAAAETAASGDDSSGGETAAAAAETQEVGTSEVSEAAAETAEESAEQVADEAAAAAPATEEPVEAAAEAPVEAAAEAPAEAAAEPAAEETAAAPATEEPVEAAAEAPVEAAAEEPAAEVAAEEPAAEAAAEAPATEAATEAPVEAAAEAPAAEAAAEAPAEAAAEAPAEAAAEPAVEETAAAPATEEPVEAAAEAPAVEVAAEEPAAEAAAEAPATEAATEAPVEAAAEAPAAEAGAEAPAEVAAEAPAAEAAPAADGEAAAEPAAAGAKPQEEDFATALAEHDQAKPEATGELPKKGDRVKGKIVKVTEERAFVDLGGKSEGAIPIEDLKDNEGKLTAGEGTEIRAVVTGEEDGTLLLRIRLGRTDSRMAELRTAFEQKMPVEGKVTGFNKGGAEVRLAGFRAFCPVSQLDLRYVEDPAVFVGQDLSFQITQLEERPKKGRRPNIVVSRKAILKKEADKQAAETRKTLRVGATMEGKVRSMTNYGAFVDLGGLDGLLHVSEIDYGRVRHPKDVLAIGQKLEVKVIKVEPGKGPGDERISLSLRALQPDPWVEVARKLPRGTITKGKVVRLESFGAFVELMPGIDGLVHISALGVDRRVNHPREVVEAGKEVEVKVLKVDTAARRISLSMDLDGTSEAEMGDLSNYQEAPAGSSGFGSLGDFFKKAQIDTPAESSKS